MLLINRHITLKLLLILLALALIGCKNKLIPEKDMVTIMSKVFTADATESTVSISSLYQRRDSIEFYQSIYKPMGYTTQQFERTIDYYVNNLDLLDQLLDKVINELLLNETKLNAELTDYRRRQSEEKDNNLWNGKKFWFLPRYGKQETIDFRIKLKGFGEYVVSADVKVWPDDGSNTCGMSAWFEYDNPSGHPARTAEKHVFYTQDSVFTNYSLSIACVDTSATYLAGSLMYHYPKKGIREKHAEVRNIVVNYYPLPHTYHIERSSPINDSIFNKLKHSLPLSAKEKGLKGK